MLSYRHSYHAGNFADVLKHIVIIEVIQHLILKPAAFDYIETHAGAGLYALGGNHAQKLREFENGIGKLEAERWPELQCYLTIIDSVNASNLLTHYPGSPFIAARMLRSRDKAWLFELHATDVELLRTNTKHARSIRVMHEDGHRGLSGLLPPASRRALILIDPSYEMKSEYRDVVRTITRAHRKFSTGVYALWYPVVERQRVNKLEQELISSGIRNIQRFELGVTADTPGTGMTAAGMIVINPPWTLQEKMNLLLPRLVTVLGSNSTAFFKSDTLCSE